MAVIFAKLSMAVFLTFPAFHDSLDELVVRCTAIPEPAVRFGGLAHILRYQNGFLAAAKGAGSDMCIVLAHDREEMY